MFLLYHPPRLNILDTPKLLLLHSVHSLQTTETNSLPFMPNALRVFLHEDDTV